MQGDRVPVAVLGATGAVGQRFVQLLAQHPWFDLVAVAASERSAGRRYIDVCPWVMPGDPPDTIAQLLVAPLDPELGGQCRRQPRLAFSALPSPVAREVEPLFARAGYAVCSNASAFRQEPDVPLVIPEVNPDHLALVEHQRVARDWRGYIVTSPNCTTTGIAIPLKPLDQAFRLRCVLAVSMQAASGAGYPGVPSLDIIDNVIPYIAGEEEKLEQETRILLGEVRDGSRIQADFRISAQTNRVPVTDGHTVCLALGFDRPPTVAEAIEVLERFRGPEPRALITGQGSAGRGATLPSAPNRPLIVRSEPDRPQPRRDRDAERGMAVTVGRIRTCPVLDLRMVSVSHNTLRGAAGGSLLNAELLVAEGYVQ